MLGIFYIKGLEGSCLSKKENSCMIFSSNIFVGEFKFIALTKILIVISSLYVCMAKNSYFLLLQSITTDEEIRACNNKNMSCIYKSTN